MSTKKKLAIAVLAIFLIGVLVYVFDNSSKNNNINTNKNISNTATTTTPTVKQKVIVQKSSASSVYVNIYNDSFSPKNLTIKAGTTVTWVNKDSNFQSITSDVIGPTSPSLTNGKTYSYKFSTPGIYGYHNSNYASTTGTIIVQ